MGTLRERVWESLRRAGETGLAVAALATSLGTTPESVMEAVMEDMLVALDGDDAPPIYCKPGPVLVPRRML